MELNVEITYSGARSGPETWRGVFRAEADTLYDCSGFTSMDDDGHGISDSGVAYEAEFGGTYPADEGKERRLSVQMRFEWGYYDIDLMPGHFQGPGSYFWRSRRDETTPVHAGATHVDRPESPVRMYGYLAGKPDYQVSTEPSGWLTAVWCGEKCTERHYCTIDVTKASLDWFEAEFQCRYEMSSPPAAVPEEAHNAGYLEYSGRIGFQPGVCPFSPP